MPFLCALFHLFHPMMDDPFWLILLRWLVTVLTMLTAGFAALFLETAALNRVVRHLEDRLTMPRRRRNRPRRATFHMAFER